MSFHCFYKIGGKSGNVSEGGPKVTYALIPVIPEFVESLVETNGETEGAGEDAGDKDACGRGIHNSSQSLC